MPPLRVILHPGFHKTGTTSAQQALRANRAALSPHVRIILRPGMAALCEAARAWSVSRDPLEMSLLTYEAAKLADGWAPEDPRPVLLACEDLAGHMPGRHGLASYDATPELMQALVETIRQVRPDATFTFFFSTRAADPWLASCHAQHLAASRMTLSARDYARAFRASADLDAIADRVARAVAPHPVHRRTLEDSRDRPLGPLDPLLDVIGVPVAVRAALAPAALANSAPDAATRAALLRLNRGGGSDAEVHAAKRALLRGRG